MESEFEPDRSLERGRVGDGMERSAVKSTHRMRYAAETKVFKDQHGGLENIRQKLGFSRRKMCQLLLVDPSAWTRWTRDESKVPPHVYRSLEWFLALNQKVQTQPELADLFLVRHKLAGHGAFDPQRHRDQAILLADLVAIKKELHRQRQIIWCLIAALLILGIASSLLTFWH